MLDKELNAETQEIRARAYALYKERGFQNGEEFLSWLEAEREVGERHRDKSAGRTRNILLMIAGLLAVIIMILLAIMLTERAPVTLSKTSLSKLKVMMVVLDPKADEKVVVFGDTHFAFNESTLSEEAKTELNADIQSLKDHPQINVRMAGYTSAEGTDADNQLLSERRATAVRDHLVANGIAADRISVVGYGRTRPAVFEVTPSDSNSAAAKANMRVLFEVVVR